MVEQTGRTVVVRRAEWPGDLGWTVMAHGEVHAEQFGWDRDFEALVARIVAEYATSHDPDREAAWIAEVDGVRAGSILLVAWRRARCRQAPHPARHPDGRGLGLGTRLVEECVSFARDAGYDAITLWTNDVLTSARRIYESFGFTLTEQERHHSFGHDLVGQSWTLRLAI